MFARDVHTNVLMVVMDAYMATSLARASERVPGFGALRVLLVVQACRWWLRWSKLQHRLRCLGGSLKEDMLEGWGCVCVPRQDTRGGQGIFRFKMTKCEDIPTGISLCCDSALAHKKEFSIFKFPERFFGDLLHRSHNMFHFSTMLII